jgi:hypothetical protein
MQSFGEQVQGCVQVKEALKQMHRLDKSLREKTIEQIMVAKETAPDKWAEREQRRLMQRQQHVTKLLERARQEHARQCDSLPVLPPHCADMLIA